MDLSINSRVVASRDHVSCELEGEAVILNLDNSVYYGLNDTAVAIWKLIEKPAYVWEIRDEIAQQFEVELDSCERDVLDLLGQLKDCSLLETVSS
jgi:hypothetical protein